MFLFNLSLKFFCRTHNVFKIWLIEIWNQLHDFQICSTLKFKILPYYLDLNEYWNKKVAQNYFSVFLYVDFSFHQLFFVISFIT